jgi:hypothetical protein
MTSPGDWDLRYRGQRLDGPVAELHQAIDRLRADTVPAPLHQSPSASTRSPRRRPDPSDGQTRLLEEAS